MDTSAFCTYTGNNCIIPEFLQNAPIIKFLIDNAFYALQSSRCNNIFEPIPYSWKELDIQPSDAISKLKINTNLDKIIQAIQTSPDDESLLGKLGIYTYGFIKFIICTNPAINMTHYNLLTMADFGGEMEYEFRHKNLEQYKMNYSYEIDERFSKEKTIYLYHGSPFENWYSIMRNGIKIGSKNKKLFLNGAVYGDGIYLSNDINLSLGYSTTPYTKENIDKRVLAIYEVIDNPEWKKTDNIFVIDDENALILRYLIIFQNYGKMNTVIYNALNQKLNSGALKAYEIEKEKKQEAIMSKAYNKRLLIEYKKIMKKTVDELGFSVQLAEEGNLRVWKMFIHKVDNVVLEEQMRKLNIPYIEMEMHFPEGYPMEPPFPRIIYPHFCELTGHITRGGSICMEALSKSGWVPTTSIEALMIQIKIVLADGNARIDETHFTKRYNFEDAKTAFNLAMQNHGWN